MEAPPDNPPPRRRRTPWVVRTAFAWSQLLLAMSAVRVLAATGGWLPPRVLADGYLGPGVIASVGVAIGLLGLVGAVVAWRRTHWLRRFGLVLLVGAHAVMLAVFPTRSLLAWFQTDDALFFVDTDRPVFALTIDDGLDPEATPRLLEVLAKHEAKATFFVLGETLETDPELARRCLDEGHELVNHQMTDTPAITLSDDELERRLRRADRLLREITEPRWFRPGGGIPTERAEEVARDLGCGLALASVFPFDSHIASIDFIAAYVAGRAEQGEIVVVHDRGERGLRAAAALDRALPKLAARGLRAVTLSQLVGESE